MFSDYMKTLFNGVGSAAPAPIIGLNFVRPEKENKVCRADTDRKRKRKMTKASKRRNRK